MVLRLRTYSEAKHLEAVSSRWPPAQLFAPKSHEVASGMILCANGSVGFPLLVFNQEAGPFPSPTAPSR